MKEKSDLTVACVILNFNDSENTISLMQRIYDYREIDNIIIVDNCSTDCSYDNLLPYNDKKVSILQTSRNGGYGYGNNFGICYAYKKLNSEYVIIANPDVIFEEACIKQFKSAFNEFNRCAVVSAVPYTIYGNPQYVFAWRLPNVFSITISASGIFSRLFLRKERYKMQEIKSPVSLMQVDCIAGAFLMIDLEVMMRYGMYDEEMFLFGEETVLGLKMKSAGYKTVLCLNQKYTHIHSVSIDKTYNSAIKKQKILLKSKVLILRKYLNVNKKKMTIINIFFLYTLLETFFSQTVRQSVKGLLKK